MIYLDHNATTPILPEVREAMLPYLKEEWGNPSSSYRFGSHLKSKIENAREQVAELIGANIPGEVLFTSGGTESNNTAIHSAIHSTTKRHVITSQVEHSSVLSYCRFLEKFRGYRVTYLPVDREGLMSLADLEEAIEPSTALVSLMWANNETGVLFPIEEIGQLCRSRGIPFHCDAVQSVGKLPISIKDLPIDYLSLTGHKIGAAKGIGALYVKESVTFVPFVHGGHQERCHRGGTENISHLIGLGLAAALTKKGVSAYEGSVRPLRDSLEDGVLRLFTGATLNGHHSLRLANTSNITVEGIDSDMRLTFLDSRSICASSGSACMASAISPSHVIMAMSGSHTRATESIRFSFSTSNCINDVTTLLDTLRQLLMPLT